MDTRAPYEPPAAPVADPPQPPGRFTRWEKILIVVLLVNAATGLFFIGGAFLATGTSSRVLVAAALTLPALGFISAGLMLRAPTLALALGALFYFVQSIAYMGPSGTWGVRSGFNVTISVPHGDGILALNAFALVFGFMHIVAAANRHARSRLDSSESVA